MRCDNWLVDEIISLAIKEDQGTGDLTGESLLSEDLICRAEIIGKEDFVLAGIKVAQKVFARLDKEISFKASVQDGAKVSCGQKIAEIEGNALHILQGERIALNFLQRMSGIATKTNRIVRMVSDFPVKIVDTRKTAPGHRVLDKHAVKVGGGVNHRMGLFDAVMIKDNHIVAARGIASAIEKARRGIPFTCQVEVEVKNLAEVAEAVVAGADIIMLDNMKVEEMKKACEIIKDKAIIEASGNIDEENLLKVASCGVDVISMGALTHQVKAVDISLNIHL